jgi:hypothetical protein
VNGRTVELLDGNTFVVSDESGDIEATATDPTGLFAFDTRFLSTWVLTVDGTRLSPLSDRSRVRQRGGVCCAVGLSQLRCRSAPQWAGRPRTDDQGALTANDPRRLDLPWRPFVMHPGLVGELFPMPRVGDVFDDVRDNGRTMRVSCHVERGAVVVSLWQGSLCRGSFRLAAGDLDRFISTLTEMGMSLGLTPASKQAEASSPNRPDLGSAAVAGTARDPGQPQFEQTEDATGTANFGRPLPVPVPRVA